MSRLIPIVLALFVALAAWMIPEADDARISALQANQLLDLKAGPDPAPETDDQRKSLWQLIFASPAVVTTDSEVVLTLLGVRHSTQIEPSVDEESNTVNLDAILYHDLARSSLKRGLRQAYDGGLPLRIVDAVEDKALETGTAAASFLVSHLTDRHKTPAEGEELLPDRQVIRFEVYNAPSFEPITLTREWRAPGKNSVIPPILAVLLAILLRKPLISLLGAVICGSFLYYRAAGESLGASALHGLRGTVDHLFWDQVVDMDRTYTILFVFFMLAMVGVMTRAGGIHGLMNTVSKYAKDARRTQIATWLMGLVIFFDDYANTILVGTTMRPLTDKFKVAREKLSFIVDSTAAPVAGLSVFSTWIAFEVSTFNKHLPAAGMSVNDGYTVFFRSIPYSFYCIFTMLFVGLITITGRDFGPMLAAERRARKTGQVIREGATPMVSEEVTDMSVADGIRPSTWTAVLPLLTFIGVTLFAIFYKGATSEPEIPNKLSIQGFTAMLYAGSGAYSLFVGSLAGFAVAALLALRLGLRREIITSALKTVRAMAVGFAILYLAWMIGEVCGDLGTATFLTALVGDGLAGQDLPMLFFVLAGAVALATGSSWSTMSILLPLVVGMSYTLGTPLGLGPDEVSSGQQLMVICVAAVLSGAIFGDHCSPISDTTIMSSIASASDHIDHVKTQVPYALSMMAVSLVCGYFPATYFNMSPWLCLAMGSVATVGIVFIFGKKVDQPAAPPA